MMKRKKNIVSYNMSRIKATGTTIERIMSTALWKAGMRGYRKNSRNIIGKPDFSWKNYKIAVFCDSGFWHGYKWNKKKKKEIKTRRQFWINKIESNIKRDKFVNKELKKQGWKVIRFWDRQIEKDSERCARKVEKALNSRKEKMEGVYTTIDLFAGIGGIRRGFEDIGKYKTVYANDNDKYACNVYDNNFPEGPKIDRRDIWNVLAKKNIPKFDILLGGFPCQAFSLAGGKKGFKDKRGILFFAIETILSKYKPKAFLLENVKHLINHDKKQTFKIILDILENKLKYKVFYKVLNSSYFGVPQNRERIYIVGFKNKKTEFEFPEGKKYLKGIESVLEKKVDIKHYLSEKYLQGLENHRNRHKAKGNGFGYNVLDKKQHAFALVCGGMGRERNLVKDKIPKEPYKYTSGKIKLNSKGIRKLTPRECAKLQGYPDTYLPTSDTQAHKQLSNSVTVTVIRAIAEKIYESLGR